MMIDTHCHLTYDGLAEQVDRVIADAHAAGVDTMISVGTTPSDAQRAIALAQRQDCVYATVGLHPHYAAEYQDAEELISLLQPLAAEPRVVALGEMGLDKHYPDPPLGLQQAALEAQLSLAAQPQLSHLPIVIHNREATDETLAVLRSSGLDPTRFVFHCFTGTRGELDTILAFGATVGFTGIVTFSSARDLAEASDAVPLDRLLIETDSPYLTPAPHRKIRPNQPRYVVHVAEFLAARRGMDVNQFTAATDTNAQRIFGL